MSSSPKTHTWPTLKTDSQLTEENAPSFASEAMIKPRKSYKDLPFELREMIWKFALPDPRRLRLTKPNKNGKRVVCKLGCNPPSMLQVCQLSRSVALKHYELASLFSRSQESTLIYVDFTRDIIVAGSLDVIDNYQRRPLLPGLLHGPDIVKIQNIALEGFPLFHGARTSQHYLTVQLAPTLVPFEGITMFWCLQWTDYHSLRSITIVDFERREVTIDANRVWLSRHDTIINMQPMDFDVYKLRDILESIASLIRLYFTDFPTPKRRIPKVTIDGLMSYRRCPLF